MSCVSAKRNSGGGDVALVTNIEIPEPYKTILKREGVRVETREFDRFNFGADYKSSLAFYKLCALYHMAYETEYDYYCFLDSDVYVQRSFEAIWEEAEGECLLYDTGATLFDGFRSELTKHYGTGAKRWLHFGGEFFAANRNDTLKFLSSCENVYEDIVSREIQLNSGDEFITSVAAQTGEIPVHNAAPYIQRYWTRRYRLVSTNYRFDPVCVLHVPAEKETGMIRLYERFIRKGKTPSNHAVWRTLHLLRPPFLIRVYWLVTDIFHGSDFVSGRIFTRS